MKVADLLDARRENWDELEMLCARLQSARRESVSAEDILRFAALYRMACADLALADAYQFPPNAVRYLHRLVGMAHNQLYRSRRLAVTSWARTLLQDTPRRIFQDGCVQLACLLFWGPFLLSAWLAYQSSVWPDYAERILTPKGIEGLEADFSREISGREGYTNLLMAGFYIRHNTSIGLQCFAGGLLVVPGLLITFYNAASLGAAFGHMARPDVAAGMNFFHFVTAHGPFELTAIVFSAAAGLRLGWGWMHTGGWSRRASLRRAGRDAMPLMGVAMILFFCAACIEAFVSPSAAPYAAKAGVAVACSVCLLFYLVVLGVYRSPAHAA